MLAVSFFGPESGGIVLYRIDGQQLIGHWSAPLAEGQVFEETLTRDGKPAGAVVNHSTAGAASTAVGNASVRIIASDLELTVQVGLSFAGRRDAASSTLSGLN